MLYNELEQEDILSGVRLRLVTIAYVDILLRSIGPVYKIRQTPESLFMPYPQCGVIVTYRAYSVFRLRGVKI